LTVNAQGATGFTYTTTCQNWTTGKEKIYEGAVPDYVDLEQCYDETGKHIGANFIGAYATAQMSGNIALQERNCNARLHLLCMEQ